MKLRERATLRSRQRIHPLTVSAVVRADGRALGLRLGVEEGKQGTSEDSGPKVV